MAEDPDGSQVLEAVSLDGERAGHPLAEGLKGSLVGMNGTDPDGRRLLDFSNRLVSQLIRMPPRLVAIDRVEDVADMDQPVAATAEHRAAFPGDKSIYYEL